MKLRKILPLLVALFCATTSFAQDARQILERVSAAMAELNHSGAEMTLDARIPILGTIHSRVWTLGDKQKTITQFGKKKQISWIDGQSVWDYDEKSRTVTIRTDTHSAPDDNVSLIEDVLSGYDISIKEERTDVWIIACRRSKSNKDKDAPKTMEFTVEKGSYKPVSMESRSTGLTYTLRYVKFGVSDKDVTFDPAECNGATIKDRRQ